MFSLEKASKYYDEQEFSGLPYPLLPRSLEFEKQQKNSSNVIYNEDDVIQVGKLCVLQLLLQVL